MGTSIRNAPASSVTPTLVSTLAVDCTTCNVTSTPAGGGAPAVPLVSLPSTAVGPWARARAGSKATKSRKATKATNISRQERIDYPISTRWPQWRHCSPVTANGFPHARHDTAEARS